MAPEPSDHGQGIPGYVLAPAQCPRTSAPDSRHQVSQSHTLPTSLAKAPKSLLLPQALLGLTQTPTQVKSNTKVRTLTLMP